MSNARLSVPPWVRVVVSLFVYGYAVRLVIMQDGSLPRGDRWEHMKGWPPVLFGLLILLGLGSMQVAGYMKRSGKSPGACRVVQSVAYLVLVIWGILGWANIA